MKKTNNSRKKPERAPTTHKKRGASKVDRPTARGYVIRFPDREARLRAIMVLGTVGVPYIGIPDSDGGVLYGVMNKHIEVLQEEEIPFEIVS